MDEIAHGFTYTNSFDLRYVVPFLRASSVRHVCCLNKIIFRLQLKPNIFLHIAGASLGFKRLNGYNIANINYRRGIEQAIKMMGMLITNFYCNLWAQATKTLRRARGCKSTLNYASNSSLAASCGRKFSSFVMMYTCAAMRISGKHNRTDIGKTWINLYASGATQAFSTF